MLGKDHIWFGTTLAVVLDSELHISGQPLLASISSPSAVTLSLIVNKIVFYAVVAFGTLLPDIDEAHSIVGHFCGIFSKEIQHFIGHRRFFHSLLGLVPWALLSLGLYALATGVLAQHGMALPADAVGTCQIAFEALLLGCATHLVADGLTTEGVPLLWPNPVHFGFPPNPRWRIRTGHLREYLTVYLFMALVVFLIFRSVLTI